MKGKELVAEVIGELQTLVDRGVVDATVVTGGVPEEWDAQRAQVAVDMRMSARNAPVYLEMARKRLEHLEKVQAENDRPLVQLNIGQIVVVKPQEYPVLEMGKGDA
jgi:hypothetical protein